MKTTSFFKVLGLGLLLFNSSACTRKESDKPASIQVSLPQQMNSQKNGVLSTQILGHVVVNVSGPGLSSPIVQSYDRCHECATLTPAPSTISLDVPQGENRLFQVLAVYMDVDTNEMDFFYGDRVANISGSDTQVPISISTLNGAASIFGGNVSGRYLDASGNGPSGEVYVKYYPSGKPGLIVEKSAIAGGWFSFFALQGASFRYELANGEALFGGQDVSLSSPLFEPSQSVMKVTYPQYKRKNQGPNNVVELKPNEPEVYVFGFWGPGSSGKKVCHTMTGTTLDRVVRFDQTSTFINDLFDAVKHSSACRLIWRCDGSLFYQGGVSSTTCANDLEYISKYSVSLSQLNGQGKDQASGLAIPFRTQSGGYPVGLSLVSGVVQLTGQLLPNTNSLFASLRLYKLTGAAANSFQYNESNGFSCADVINRGFVDAGMGSFDANGNFSIVTNATLADYQSGGLSMAMCFNDANGAPLVRGRYLPSYMLSSLFYNTGGSGSVGSGGGSGNGNGSGGGGSQAAGPAAKLAVSKNMSPINIAQSNQCYDFTVGIMDSSDRPAVAPSSPTTVSFSLTGGDAKVYTSNAECMNNSSNYVPDADIVAGQNFRQFWLRTPGSPANISVSVSATGLTTAAMDIQVFQSGPNKYAMPEIPDAILAGICYSTKISLVSTYGYPEYNSSGSALTVNISSPSGYDFYSDSACGTQATTAVIANSAGDTSIFVKVAASVTSGDILLTTSGAGLVTAIYRKRQGTGNSTPSQLSLIGSNQNYIDSCTGPYEITAVNSSQTAVPATATTTLTLSSTRNAVFYDQNCGNVIPNLTLSLGEFRKKFWVKYGSAGTGTVSASGGGLSGSQNISVQGVYKFNLDSPDTVTPNHGQCIKLVVNPTEFPSNSVASWPFVPSLTISFLGFPTGSLFKSRVGGECLEPLAGPIVKPANFSFSPNLEVYYLALNTSSTPMLTGPGNYRVSVAGYTDGDPLNVTIGGIPSLAALEGNSGDASTEFPFLISSIVARFTGIPSLINEFFSGSWTTANVTALLNNTGKNTRVTDSVASTVAYSVSGRNATWVADFTTGSLPANFIVNRGTGGYAIDGSGNMVFQGIDTPRFDRNPMPGSGFPVRGLLVEKSMTNLMVNAGATASENFSIWQNVSGATVVVTNATSTLDPLGNTSNPWKIDDNNSGNGSNVERLYAQWMNSTPTYTDYTASIFLKKSTSRYAAFSANSNMNGSGGVVVDLDTGNAVMMDGSSANTNFGVVKHVNGWYRVWVKFNTNYFYSGGFQGGFFLYPAFCDSAGSLCSGYGQYSAVGSIFAFGAQVELGSEMTSYYPSDVTGGVRFAEGVTIASSNITGLSATQGTFRVQMASAATARAGSILSVGNSTDNIEIGGVSATSAELFSRVVSGGAVQVTVNSNLPLLPVGPNVVAASYILGGSPAPLRLVGNGYPIKSADISGTTAPNLSGEYLRLGGDYTGTNMNAVFSKVHYWPYAFGLPGLISAAPP